MAKKQHFPNNILPSFKLGARFCYFLDLNSSAEELSNINKPLYKHKKALANDAIKMWIYPTISLKS